MQGVLAVERNRLLEFRNGLVDIGRGLLVRVGRRQVAMDDREGGVDRLGGFPKLGGLIRLPVAFIAARSTSMTSFWKGKT
jgi:hypothetical protein